jgi:outer membrane protein insertion porin family/translocation and assembly module TamA
VRIPAGESVSVVVFCDSGDVSPFRVDIHPDRPQLSCGTGGRYDTPVGPIRLDVGYRIPELQYGDKKPYDVDPDTLLGLPIAISFAIGEAF